MPAHRTLDRRRQHQLREATGDTTGERRPNISSVQSLSWDYARRSRPRREAGPFAFEEAAMPGTNNHQAGTRRAAIYARVSDKSQDTDD